jgi:tRNA pseudouridine38-40 synthase
LFALWIWINKIQRHDMPTYQMTVEYDGTNWHGWQIQPDHQTIQGEIEKALSTAVRARTPIVGSGRTDAGVHARGQIAHFLLPNPVDTAKLEHSLNGILPDTISVSHIRLMHDSFHARFDAHSRAYSYSVRMSPSALDHRFSWLVRPLPEISRMNEAALHLIGTANYSAFCLTASETKNRQCTISRADWNQGSHERSLVFRIEADRFLHGMVRAIVGTLIEVGHGKRNPNDLVDIIDSLDRRNAGVAAPARGLVLERVGYPLRIAMSDTRDA